MDKVLLTQFTGRSKWRTIKENHTPALLVLVGDAGDLSYCGVYRLGRIHCLHTQNRKGIKIVRRATASINVRNNKTAHMGLSYKLPLLFSQTLRT